MAAQGPTPNVEEPKPADGGAGLPGADPSSARIPAAAPTTDERLTNMAAVDPPQVREQPFARSFVGGPAPDEPATHVPPLVQPESAPTQEENFDFMCLCMVAALGLFLLAFFLVVCRHFYSSAEASRLRSCGDTVVWERGSLKEQFETCTEGGCTDSLCGPATTIACEAHVPWFGNKCECCDWCLRKALDESGFAKRALEKAWTQGPVAKLSRGWQRKAARGGLHSEMRFPIPAARHRQSRAPPKKTVAEVELPASTGRWPDLVPVAHLINLCTFESTPRGNLFRPAMDDLEEYVRLGDEPGIANRALEKAWTQGPVAKLSRGWQRKPARGGLHSEMCFLIPAARHRESRVPPKKTVAQVELPPSTRRWPNLVSVAHLISLCPFESTPRGNVFSWAQAEIVALSHA
ncbi:hypothetical protein HPB50_027834 [Hyalomma asiaticum]|nr:hypothetical protein HPB50_027834 [Hyalomma asiaticum]